MISLEHYWYRPSFTIMTFLLYPLSLLFRMIVGIRRFLYWSKLKKSVQFPVPVIVIGNITVGGTGKTPFAIWLAKFLLAHGYRPGIVSRGMGGKQSYQPRWVAIDANPLDVGDEAILLKRHSCCPVVIGIDRIAAVKELLANSDCNLVISDDGLQHYRLERAIEIALIDGMRGFGNHCFLPAGPLRESPKRLNRVDFIITQTALIATPPSVISACAGVTSVGEATVKATQTLANDSQANATSYSMCLIGNDVISIQNEANKISLSELQHTSIHAVAAIGNPHRFFASLRQQGFTLVEHIFPDHYLFQARDFAFDDKLPIIMTEKDAVKCKEFADDRFWYVPVEVKISSQFGKALCRRLNHVSANIASHAILDVR